MIAKARAAAFEILLKVSTTDAHSDELLRSPQVDSLSAQDRALTHTLVLGTLRWQLVLDARIRPLLSRPGAKLAPAVETALRLGAYQLMYLDRIPPHAAIGESVELAKKAGERFASGLVNAVLRKIASAPRAAAENTAETVEAHPKWMVERWIRAYGEEATRAICSFDQQPAGVSVRLLHPEAEASLLQAGIEMLPGEFLTSVRRVVSGDVIRSEAFGRGWVRIQDEGSQLIAELAGRGQKILDTCAAPGGKTAILAERNPGAPLTAWDVSRRRLDGMRGLLGSFGDRIQFAEQDASTARLERQYDLILCDVPCSGTGTIARNPEIRFRVSEEDLRRQQERQARILSATLQGVAPRGRLVYSTCSLETEENEAVVEQALTQQTCFHLLPVASVAEELAEQNAVHTDGFRLLREGAISGNFLRTLPGVMQCDGFFAAIFQRD